MRLFPKGFTWGTATASFQVEGATTEGGRGESIWDRFASTAGHIITGETGDPACDSYHRYAGDIAVMRELGANAYRFSLAWPRIIPDGSGQVNAAGLDYYDRLVDALLEAEIVPFVTLYHWDLPQALQDRGGWARREAIDAFVRYADIAASHLGDRVKHWATHNEPTNIAFRSYATGEHAPGMRNPALSLQVAHNVLVSHGAAVPVIRRQCPDAKVGIVINVYPAYPETDSEADRIAAQFYDESQNRWFLDPICGRGYPAMAWGAKGSDVPAIQAGDMETIATPIDYLGLNYYRRRVCHDPAGGEGHRMLNRRDPANVTARDWEIFPQGLKDVLSTLTDDYGFANIYVTENGAAYHDTVSPDGQVHDPARQAYLARHLHAVLDAIDAGAPIRGYFCWTLMDNFEWAFGTSSRFGLAYTDFPTQRRIIKDSGHWFGRVTRANALVE